MDSDAAVVAATRRWLEIAVIGLPLCPFAAAVHRSGRIRFQVSRAVDAQQLQADLAAELKRLAATDTQEIETTLLILPDALPDFADYNRFLGRADRTVARLGLRGVFQLASFHPGYRFAGSTPDDIANWTNRSPYPILQILREASVAQATAGLADPAAIYRGNIDSLRRLGHAGWLKLWAGDAAAAGGNTQAVDSDTRDPGEGVSD